ncbi:NFYB/HAP3 family transcription factor subunit [Candidatus Woesearchaeota archaeon]|nr:NFYB/HAP3 family transcription factor subunit [Candidatus Woesearchaeota archaeon]
MTQKRANVIPYAPMGRILQNAGAKRVSQASLEVFASIVTDIAEDIGKRAWEIAKHSGRKTIHEEDIRLAAKK